MRNWSFLFFSFFVIYLLPRYHLLLSFVCVCVCVCVFFFLYFLCVCVFFFLFSFFVVCFSGYDVAQGGSW
jgi:hypothetical protein